MKIGIISDSHDNIENTRKALEQLKECGVLIHCGDFCAPFMVAEIAKFDGEVHCCFGNTDDRFTSTKVAAGNKVNLHGDIGKIGADAKKIAFTHFPQFGEALASTGKFDVVFHGHSHQKRKEKVGDCWLVNPGEIMGKAGKPSYAVYDTQSDEVEIVEF